jgi:ribosomal protein S26
MRRGCIPTGEIRCNECQRIIPHSERYLAVDEEDGVEVENGTTTHYCVECALQKGYAYYKEEKDEKILTFFP